MPESSPPSPTLPADLGDLVARCRALPLPRLVEALRADQARHWRSGRPLPAETYLGAFPALAASPEDALVLVWGEALLRLEAGEAPRFEEYRARFPQHADALALQFELQGHLEPSPGAPTLAQREPPGEVGPPRAVPGYEILGELGRGGMGVVYKARQASLNRVVALKMLLAGAYAGPEQHARFRAEAEAVARLRHPNIVQIFEVGEHAGRPYLVLEYVEGGSLDAVLGGTPQNPRAAAALAETLARAVHAAHQQGVIHRDLKPANVLLSFSRERPASADAEALAGRSRLNEAVPKIADFGLAKQLGGDSGRTPSGAVLGTPSYMAPEQASGRAGAVGPAADVYALGAILYELLTGRPPFQGETPLDTLQQVVADDPVPPRVLQPKVPVDLATICLKCLQKEPARRYGGAGELADDLRRFLAGEPIKARPPGPPGRLYRWCRRRPAPAALLALLVVGTAVSTWQAVRATVAERERDRQRQHAEDNLRDARENFQLSLDAVEQLGTDLSEDKRLQEHDLRPLRQQLLRKVAHFQEVFVSKRRDDPEILAQQARASFLLGQLTSQIDSKERAIDYFLQARDILEGLRASQPDVPAHTAQLARCLRHLGAQYVVTGKKAEALAAFDEARSLSEGLAKAHPDVADNQREQAAALVALGRFYDTFGPAADAEKPLRRAVEILDGLARRQPHIAATLHDLALSQAMLGGFYNSHLELRHWKEAKQHYELALEAQKELVELDPRAPDYQEGLGRYWFYLARWYRKGSQLDEADKHYRNALAVLEPLAGEHPSMMAYAGLLAEVYHDRGISRKLAQDWQGARDAFRKALTVREAQAARDPGDAFSRLMVCITQSDLGDLALEQGDPRGADEWCGRALRTCDEAKKLSRDDLRVGEYLSLIHFTRARARTRLGQHAAALEDWNDGLDVYKGPDRPWYCLQKALTLARTGKHAEAKREVEDVMGEGARPSGHVVRRLARDAAAVYAVAAVTVPQDVKRSESERAALAEQYARAGVESLQLAVKNGYDDLKNLEQDKDLDPLRERDDFRKLAEGLRGRSGPR